MISQYLREQRRYTQKELSVLLECSETELVPLIRKLKEYGVVKAVKKSDLQRDMSDLLEEDIEIAEVEAGENEYLYVFTFVGVIVAAGRVLKCYPKYLLHTERLKEEMIQILKILGKYHSREQIVRMFYDSSERGSFNLLAVLLYLLQDYHENGSYINTKEKIESNGTGEILWEKTIYETFPLFFQERPYYPELKTRRRTRNEQDYFKRLHECVVTRVSKELEEADLLELFEMTGVDVSEEVLEDFGEKEVILYRLEKEINVQFQTRKQWVLKILHTYIAHSGSLYDTDAFSLFGTTAFHVAWEKMCAEILDNQLNVRLKDLLLPVPLKKQYCFSDRLIDLIEKPSWTATGKTAKSTLIPDLISIVKIQGKWQFIIFDAKYYTAKLSPGELPQGQPGIESITKQYLYQLAYQGFIQDHEFQGVKNCFLLPTEEEKIMDGGEASLHFLEQLGLQNIKVRYIPAKWVYEAYLNGRKIDISDLCL